MGTNYPNEMGCFHTYSPSIRSTYWYSQRFEDLIINIVKEVKLSLRFGFLKEWSPKFPKCLWSELVSQLRRVALEMLAHLKVFVKTICLRFLVTYSRFVKLDSSRLSWEIMFFSPEAQSLKHHNIWFIHPLTLSKTHNCELGKWKNYLPQY